MDGWNTAREPGVMLMLAIHITHHTSHITHHTSHRLWHGILRPQRLALLLRDGGCVERGRPVFSEYVLLTLAALIKCNNLVALIKCNNFSGTQTATNPNRQFLFSGRNCDGNLTAQGVNATFCHLDDDESERGWGACVMCDV